MSQSWPDYGIKTIISLCAESRLEPSNTRTVSEVPNHLTTALDYQTLLLKTFVKGFADVKPHFNVKRRIDNLLLTFEYKLVS